mgnify:CR=1 FL=1
MNTLIDSTIDDKAASHFLPAIRFAIVSIVLFGLLYPVLATYTGKLLFPQQANGSLILRDGKAIGSSLVAQNFVSDGYFQSRPSAANFDPWRVAIWHRAIQHFASALVKHLRLSLLVKILPQTAFLLIWLRHPVPVLIRIFHLKPLRFKWRESQKHADSQLCKSKPLSMPTRKCPHSASWDKHE